MPPPGSPNVPPMHMDIDPEIFDGSEQAAYIGQWGFELSSVEVAEIVLYSDRSPRVSKFIFKPQELGEWVDRKSWTRSLEQRQRERNIIGELRLIFTQPSYHENERSEAPRYPLDHPSSRPVMPFGRDTLRHIQRQLQLPLLCSQYPGSHIHSFPILLDGEDVRDGTQMLLTFPGWNNYGVGAVATISHLKDPAITNVMLFQMLKSQQLFLRDYLLSTASLASHPAAIPVLIGNLRFDRIPSVAPGHISNVVDLEANSGLSSVEGFTAESDAPLALRERCDDPMLSIKAVKLNQGVIIDQSNIQGFLVPVAALQKFVDSYLSPSDQAPGASASSRLRSMQNAILKKQLAKLQSGLQASLLSLDEIHKRVELQVAGINNQLASRNNEINLSLAKSSQRIAQETRKDSSAMKSIAVLTMVFLPATYIATLFATPGIAETSPPQRLYWAVSLPVTSLVLLVWFTWTWLEIRRIDRTSLPGVGETGKEAPDVA
ncbi:hypothetical protein QBC34DRAFT_415122 [Podospora aff. communis PSN243]|uniref:Uncharacterized protein n=1 Tax=Podospora aff. communis PSN243 TaxID=3040156 RepID=A0AAV9GB52_9PEZI|nr:hypothetical protein QBC34DRAFT_415122 [Podospora aff. communis PSN243]